MQAFAATTASSEKAGSVVSMVSSVMSVLAIASTSGLGAPLLKILRIFKLISRLRLINVFFGSYLEMFLQAAGNLYALGGDKITLETAKLQPNTRGKLDMYKVSVLSADVMAIKYAVYFLSLVVRIYRTKIRQYAWRKGQLSILDAILDSIGERCKTMLLLMVGIDIFFYSLRCVSHMDRSVSLNFIATASLLLSMVTIVMFTVEFALIYTFNRKTTFSALRKKERKARAVLKKAERIKNGTVGSAKQVKDIENPEVSKIDESKDQILNKSMNQNVNSIILSS